MTVDVSFIVSDGKGLTARTSFITVYIVSGGKG